MGILTLCIFKIFAKSWLSKEKSKCLRLPSVFVSTDKLAISPS